MSLTTATEFSFFLAVPTLTGATFIKMLKIYPRITHDVVQIVLWGNVISFITGLLAISFFIRLIENFGLRYFGYYRILVGAAVLITLALGHSIEFL